MDIDERLKFLLTSTESLHASCQELHAIVAEQSREQARQFEAQTQRAEAQALRVHQLHAALLAAIRGFLEAPGEGI